MSHTVADYQGLILFFMSPKAQFNLTRFSILEIHNYQMTSDEMTCTVFLQDTFRVKLLIKTKSVSFSELLINSVA